MTLYRIVYYLNEERTKQATTKEFDDFSEMKKKARELFDLTGRPLYVEWCYSITTYGLWSLLKYCMTKADINNIKEKK